MADPYHSRRTMLKMEILARVAAGESVAGMAREAGMPSARTVSDWGRADPGFRQDLWVATQRRRAGRQALDPARAAAFLARYRAGETQKAILADPEMPSWHALARWRGLDMGFAEAVWAVAQDARSRQMRGIVRAKTPWAWDAGVADAVLVAVVKGAQLTRLAASHPGLPGRGVIARWRRERPGFDAQMRAAIRHGMRRGGRAARACGLWQAAIVDGIIAGGSLWSLSQQPGVPDATTLYRWYRHNPGFRAAVDQACQDREDVYFDAVGAAAATVTPATAAAVARRISALKRQLGRLAHRPGWKRR